MNGAAMIIISFGEYIYIYICKSMHLGGCMCVKDWNFWVMGYAYIQL